MSKTQIAIDVVALLAFVIVCFAESEGVVIGGLVIAILCFATNVFLKWRHLKVRQRNFEACANE